MSLALLGAWPHPDGQCTVQGALQEPEGPYPDLPESDWRWGGVCRAPGSAEYGTCATASQLLAGPPVLPVCHVVPLSFHRSRRLPNRPAPGGTGELS